jgi:hypothetical protein
VAAAAKSSVAQIRSVAGGAAAPVAAAPAQQYGGGGYGTAPAANSGSRFGRFNSGFPQQAPAAAPRYGAAPGYGYPQQQYQRPVPQQQYGYPQQQYQRPVPQQQYGYPQQRYQRPMPQQQYAPQQQQYARPVPAVAPPPPAAPSISQADAQARKEAYKAQREAYLARQKQQFEDKKQKVSAVHEADRSEAPPRNGVETPAVAQQPMAAAASKPAPTASAKPSKGAAASDLDDAPSEPVAAKSGGGKPALDNDFLDGLLDDPLANKKGK